MNMPSKKPNPKHHNTDRPQHPKTRFAGTLNFLNFQLRAIHSNVSRAVSNIQQSQGMRRIPEEQQEELFVLLRRAQQLHIEATELAEDIADFNVRKQWLEELDVKPTTIEQQ